MRPLPPTTLRRAIASLTTGMVVLVALMSGSGAGAAPSRTTKKATATKKRAATTRKRTTAATPTAAGASAVPATTAKPVAAASAGPKRGGTFVSVDLATGDPDHIDPALATTVPGLQVASQLYDGLVDIDNETGEVKPAVAQSWSGSSDGMQITFKLRKTAFSNGEPVLPSSFKCAWERALSPAIGSASAYHFAGVRGAKDVEEGRTRLLSGVLADDAQMTLTVLLNRPYTSFVDETQHPVFSPATKAQCAAGREHEQGVLVGNGPFQLDGSWRHDIEIKLVRAPGYYGGINGHPAYLDGVTFRIMRDGLAAYSAFEMGGAHAAPIPVGRTKEAIARYGDRAATKPMLSTQYYAFNWTDPVVGGYGNAKLRQAISVCINRQQINDTVFDGQRAVATGMTPPGVEGYKAQNAGIKPTADAAAGRRLLGEWGRPLSDPITMRVNSSVANLETASIIQQNVRECGIELDIEQRPTTTFREELRQGAGHQLFRDNWGYDFAGYDNLLYPVFDTESIGGGGENLSRFSNAEFDRLVGQARTTTDAARKASLYQAAEKILLDEAVVVPLLWGKWTYVVAKDVDRFVQGPTALVDYSEVSFK